MLRGEIHAKRGDSFFCIFVYEWIRLETVSLQEGHVFSGENLYCFL